MNGTQYATVISAPDSSGFGMVRCGDAQRSCYFQPTRFAAPWPVPSAGDRVAVSTGTPQLVALWLIGKGAPTYQYAAGGG